MNHDCACFVKRSMSIVRPLGVGFVIAGFALSACAVDTPTAIDPPPSQSLKEIAPSELKTAPPMPESSEPKQKESARAPVKPTPVESRTAEEAATRAADPKDPSGALIIKEPAGTGAKP
jgi:hypothetical protein